MQPIAKLIMRPDEAHADEPDVPAEVVAGDGRPETLADIAARLFGIEHGVDLELPPRQVGRESPRFGWRVMTTLYREIIVWRRIEGRSAHQYFCLENLSTGRFCVQNLNAHYHPPTDKQALYHLKMSTELLIEEEPTVRCGGFATLEEAIAAHDQKFGLT